LFEQSSNSMLKSSSGPSSGPSGRSSGSRGELPALASVDRPGSGRRTLQEYSDTRPQSGRRQRWGDAEESTSRPGSARSRPDSASMRHRVVLEDPGDHCSVGAEDSWSQPLSQPGQARPGSASKRPGSASMRRPWSARDRGVDMEAELDAQIALLEEAQVAVGGGRGRPS
jgi:hypothetical protein